MATLFVISPEFEKKLHPEARRIFYDWTADIQRQAQLDEVTDDDLGSLSNDEKIKLKTSVLKIPECLKKCIDIKEGDKLYDVYFGDIFWQRGVISELKRDLMFIKWDIEPPLRKIYLAKLAKAEDELRKRIEEEKRRLKEAREVVSKREEEEKQRAAKAKEEQRKREEEAEAQRREKEEEERWRAACKAVNPPIDDAKKYLNKPGEHDKYIQAALVVIEVYMEKGEEYVNDSRTIDYRWYLKEISNRKEEEKQKTAANFAAQEYNRRLNDEKMRLKALLCPNKKHLKSYFEKEINDRRYMGENFSQFLSSEEEKAFDNALVSAASRKLDNLVSNDFRQFIDGKYLRSYFLLPSAEYSLCGTPCLDFMFEVFAVVEIRVSLKLGKKTFGGYPFNLPWREEKGYSVVLKEPELLGYHYFVLAPEDLGGYTFWQSIPLVLIQGLMNGDEEPAGTTILKASESETTYRIKGFEDEVTIPDSFISCLKKVGGIDQMASMGIISEKVANIVKSKLSQLGAERNTEPLPNGQGTRFTNEELVSSLTTLGIRRKTAEELCGKIPKKLTLQEATKLALQKHSEIIAQ